MTIQIEKHFPQVILADVNQTSVTIAKNAGLLPSRRIRVTQRQRVCLAELSAYS